MSYKIGLTGIVLFAVVSAVSLYPQLHSHFTAEADTGPLATLVSPSKYSGGVDTTFYQYTNSSKRVKGKELNPPWVLSIYDEFDKSSFVGWIEIFPFESGETRLVLKDAGSETMPPKKVFDQTFAAGTTPEAIAQAIAEFEG
jgi:hypothetical protein